MIILGEFIMRVHRNQSCEIVGFWEFFWGDFQNSTALKSAACFRMDLMDGIVWKSQNHEQTSKYID